MVVGSVLTHSDFLQQSASLKWCKILTFTVFVHVSLFYILQAAPLNRRMKVNLSAPHKNKM